MICAEDSFAMLNVPIRILVLGSGQRVTAMTVAEKLMTISQECPVDKSHTHFLKKIWVQSAINLRVCTVRAPAKLLEGQNMKVGMIDYRPHVAAIRRLGMYDDVGTNDKIFRKLLFLGKGRSFVAQTKARPQFTNLQKLCSFPV